MDANCESFKILLIRIHCEECILWLVVIVYRSVMGRNYLGPILSIRLEQACLASVRCQGKTHYTMYSMATKQYACKGTLQCRYSIRQHVGFSPVLQRPLRNKLQATERYINRSFGICSVKRILKRGTTMILNSIINVLNALKLRKNGIFRITYFNVRNRLGKAINNSTGVLEWKQ